MTREEYLSALKVEIMSLTTEEQQEALQYYSDYFDAANDDEKIINELGEPKELAKEKNVSEFLHDLPHKYFEENQLHAFIICEQ